MFAKFGVLYKLMVHHIVCAAILTTSIFLERF